MFIQSADGCTVVELPYMEFDNEASKLIPWLYPVCELLLGGTLEVEDSVLYPYNAPE